MAAVDGRVRNREAPGAAAADSRRDETRRRIQSAAMTLFEQQGYDATTVDAVAAGAGVSRRTFFHHFASKDAVLFLDHTAVIAGVEQFLAGSDRARDPVATVGQALHLVMASYAQDPDLSVARYRLIRRSPELRATEIGWVQRYQLLFTRYLDERYADLPHGHLTAEVLAAGLVALHNNVLRHWLKAGGRTDAARELQDALDWFADSLAVRSREPRRRHVVVAVVDDGTDPHAVTIAVEDALRSAKRRSP